MIRRTQVGPVAYGRMTRDRIVHPLLPGIAVPLDIPDVPGVRALALAPLIPRHTVVSGLAGLWVRHGEPFTTTIDVVGARGLHRTVNPEPTSALSVRFHSGNAINDALDTFSNVGVAPTPRCLVDAMRWAPAPLSIAATTQAVQSNHVTVADIQRCLARDDPRGAGYRRLESLWAALAPALRAIADDALTR